MLNNYNKSIFGLFGGDSNMEELNHVQKKSINENPMKNLKK